MVSFPPFLFDFTLYSLDCQWVYNNDRCDRYDNNDDKHVGQYHCPKSCGFCDKNDDGNPWHTEDDEWFVYSPSDDKWHIDDDGCFDDHNFRYNSNSMKVRDPDAISSLFYKIEAYIKENS